MKRACASGLLALGSVVVFACGGAPRVEQPPPAPPDPPEPNAELSPALQPFAWLVGDWRDENAKSTEHWVANGGALFGVMLGDDGENFDVVMIDDAAGGGAADGVVRMFAEPAGQTALELRLAHQSATSVAFENPGHEPVSITYERTAAGLRNTVDAGTASELFIDLTPIAHVAAPALEAADRQLAADTAARGVDGLMANFSIEGWVLDPANAPARSEGLRAEWTRRLDGGTLTWAPTASAGNDHIGVTFGKGEYTVTATGERHHSAYVTIWTHEADGRWLVLYDTGRPVNE